MTADLEFGIYELAVDPKAPIAARRVDEDNLESAACDIEDEAADVAVYGARIVGGRIYLAVRVGAGDDMGAAARATALECRLTEDLNGRLVRCTSRHATARSMRNRLEALTAIG